MMAYLVLVSVLAVVLTAHAADPAIVADFVVPQGRDVTASFFIFRGMNQSLSDAPKNATFKVTKASQIEFPALEGQSVSVAALQYAPLGMNLPHVHPRSAELLVVVQGTLRVGLVDSGNKLFSQVLNIGDIFVFPKGLVHFQVNEDPKFPAAAISAFGSANPGLISLPKTIFGSGIASDVLAKSFKIDNKTIDELVLANMG